MRYGLNAAIIAGLSCFAPGEPARTAGGSFGDDVSGSRQALPPGFPSGDDSIFHDGQIGAAARIAIDREFDARKRGASLGLEVTPL
jgi:hypothetical protein